MARLAGNIIRCLSQKVLGSLKTVNNNLSKRWPQDIEPRTLIICKRASGYYLQLTGELPEKPLPKSDKACGLDVGLQYIYSDDDGKQIDPPKFYRKSEKRLKRLRRKLSRQQKGSNNAKAKAGLNKSFADAGLGQFLNMVETKAKAGDREFVKVEPAYTSQDCPECGHREKKSLSQRTHQCSECGYVVPRDVASARVIKTKANFKGKYRDCAREFKPVDRARAHGLKQESTSVERRGDVARTPKPSQHCQLSLNLWGSVDSVSG